MTELLVYFAFAFYIMCGFGMHALVGRDMPRPWQRVFVFVLWPLVLFASGFVVFLHFVGEI